MNCVEEVCFTTAVLSYENIDLRGEPDLKFWIVLEVNEMEML